MTSSDLIPMIAPTGVDYEGIATIQRYCHEQSRLRSFHDLPNELKQHVQDLRDSGRAELGDYIIAMYNGNRLMLIAGEATEAHEELRNGKDPSETYYATGNNDTGALQKPEGVPSELADIIIRVFDHAEELGIDLASVIKEKLEYNATRLNMHGRKF